MNRFQKLVMEIIGLDPHFYRPVNTGNRWNAMRDLTDAELSRIDSAMKDEIENSNSKFSELFTINRKVRFVDVMIDLIKNYKKG